MTKNSQKSRQDSASKAANTDAGGGRQQTNRAGLSHVTVTTKRMTPERERQFEDALGLFMVEMVHHYTRGKQESHDKE